MRKINCIIIEDEPLAAEVLVEYIGQISYLELMGKCKSTAECMDFLEKKNIDLVFLDVHLPGQKGLSFLRSLLIPPTVVVTTAYHQYAVEGFELDVTDYLLKPFSFERFTLAVKRALKEILSVSEEFKNQSSALYVMKDRKNIRIEFDDIVYIQSKKEYVEIVTIHGEYKTKMSTKEIESKLPKDRFKRIQRSYIVSLNKIESFTKRHVQIYGQVITFGKGFDFEKTI